MHEVPGAKVAGEDRVVQHDGGIADALDNALVLAPKVVAAEDAIDEVGMAEDQVEWGDEALSPEPEKRAVCTRGKLTLVGREGCALGRFSRVRIQPAAQSRRTHAWSAAQQGCRDAWRGMVSYLLANLLR